MSRENAQTLLDLRDFLRRAVAMRRAIYFNTEQSGVLRPGDAAAAAPYQHKQEAILYTLGVADLLLWRVPIWEAAQRGHEAFIGYAPAAAPVQSVQLWVPELDIGIAAEDNFSPWGIEGEFQTCAVLWVGLHDQPSAFLAQFHIANSESFREHPDWYQPPKCEPLLVELTETFRLGEPLSEDIACAYAMLKFLEQPFVDREPTMPSRQVRRQMERKGHPCPAIHTVALRRRQAHSSNGDSDREYHVQWLVSGHWRRQDSPRFKRHEPVYVHPYVKGPEDAPLKAPSKTVYEVKR